jgi:hypothetical protein
MRSEASIARPPSSPESVMRSRSRRARPRCVRWPDSESRSAGGRIRSARRRVSVRGAFRCSDGAARDPSPPCAAVRARLVCGTAAALCKGRSRPRGLDAAASQVRGALAPTPRFEADRSAGRLPDLRADRPTPAASEKPAVERSRVLRWLRELDEAGDLCLDGAPRNPQLSRSGVASCHRIAVTLPTRSRAGRRNRPFRPAAAGCV